MMAIGKWWQKINKLARTGDPKKFPDSILVDFHDFRHKSRFRMSKVSKSMSKLSVLTVVSNGLVRMKVLGGFFDFAPFRNVTNVQIDKFSIS